MFAKVLALAALFGIVAAHLPLVHEPVYHHAPQPYKFGYDIKDKHGNQYREEHGNGAGVTGSYGFTDSRGVKRQVDYVADHAGFRAQVKTNEPGTANQNPAAVQMISDAPYAGGVALNGLGYGGYGLGGGYGGYGLGGGYGVPAYGGNGYGAYGVGVGNLGGLGYGGLGLGILGGLGYTRYGY